MNKLQQFLSDENINELSAMNLLQEHGIISDNCVWAEHVPDCGSARAIFFLKEGGI